MPEESIENITTSNSNFAPTLVNSYTLLYVKFNGHRTNQIADSEKVIYFYIYISSIDLNTGFTLTKDSDSEKYWDMHKVVMVLDSILLQNFH